MQFAKIIMLNDFGDPASSETHYARVLGFCPSEGGVRAILQLAGGVCLDLSLQEITITYDIPEEQINLIFGRTQKTPKIKKPKKPKKKIIIGSGYDNQNV